MVCDVCCGAFGCVVFVCVCTRGVVLLCGVVCLGACTHVVLCVVWVLRVCALWCVCVLWCVCACGCVCVWHGLERGKKARVLIQHASLRTVSTPPCVPATGPHVFNMRACCQYTRRRADGTHGGVLNQHTGGLCLLSFSLSLLSFSILSSLSSLFSFVPSSSLLFPRFLFSSLSPLFLSSFPLLSSFFFLLLFFSLPFTPPNTVQSTDQQPWRHTLHVPLPLSATTAATSSSAIVGSVNRRQTEYP